MEPDPTPAGAPIGIPVEDLLKPRNTVSGRMMHWSCRACPARWSMPMPPLGEGGAAQRPDGEQQTLCDDCLEIMARRALGIGKG